MLTMEVSLILIVSHSTLSSGEEATWHHCVPSDEGYKAMSLAEGDGSQTKALKSVRCFAVCFL